MSRTILWEICLNTIPLYLYNNNEKNTMNNNEKYDQLFDLIRII